MALVWDYPEHPHRQGHGRTDRARSWLAVYRLPPSANEFDRLRRWSHLQRLLANLTKHTIAGLTGLMKTRTGRML